MAVADAIDPSRALQPANSGFADVDGVRISYEVFGEGEQTLLLALAEDLVGDADAVYLGEPRMGGLERP